MIVEDGTGLADADSYVSVTFADNYFSARGVSAWEGLDSAKKEQALVRATDFIDNMFQWYGKKLTVSQGLRFPRVKLFDYEGQEIAGIPVVLKQAVCDAAVIASGGTELFQAASENGDVVSENITQLSFTYKKKEKVSVPSGTLYDSINTKLRGLFKETGTNRVLCGKTERA